MWPSFAQIKSMLSKKVGLIFLLIFAQFSLAAANPICATLFTIGRHIPNDPLLLNRTFEKDTLPWHMRSEGANIEKLWQHATGSRNNLIAIIDSGFDIEHPDLAGVIDLSAYQKNGMSMEDVRHNLALDPSHGTMTIGLLGAKGNNGIGISGVNQNARILPIPLESDGIILANKRPKLFSSSSESIRFAVDSGAKIVSVSSGTRENLADAITYAEKKGVLIVAAVANTDEGGYAPAVYTLVNSNILAVGGNTTSYVKDPTGKSTIINRPWGYRNRFAVDVSAPAENLLTLKNSKSDIYSLEKGYEDNGGGTSGACPQVSGIASLLWDLKPDLTPKDIKNILIESSRREGITDELRLATRSGGVIDGGKAAELVEKIKSNMFLAYPRAISIGVDFPFEISVSSKVPYKIISDDSVKIEGLKITPLKEGDFKVKVVNEKSGQTIEIQIHAEKVQ